MAIEKLLLRVDETADALSLSRRQVYDLVKEGKLTGHQPKPGVKGLRITVISVNLYVEQFIVPTTFYQK